MDTTNFTGSNSTVHQDDYIIIFCNYTTVENSTTSNEDGITEEKQLGPLVYKLLTSAASGDQLTVQKLINSGAGLEARDVNCLTSLHYSIINGHDDLSQYLINFGASINAISQYNILPVYTAAEYDCVAVLKLILEKDPNQANRTEVTGSGPLFVAAAKDNIESMSVLLAAGAQVNAVNCQGGTALYLASQEGSVRAVELLLQYGAEVNLRKIGGYTALHSAALNGHVDVAAQLIEAGAEIDSQSNVGSCPLHVATDSGSKDVVKLLIDKGADVNARGPGGNTALHIASNNNNINIVNTLLERKSIDLNIRNDRGDTALCTAVRVGAKEVVKLLLTCRVNLKDKQSALQLAREQTDVELINLFPTDAEGDIEYLFEAVKEGNLNLVKQLIESGIPFDVKNSKNQTPLEVAIRCKKFETATWLIKEIAYNDMNTDGPVLCEKHYKVLNYSLNNQDDDGNTLLHHAVLSNNGVRTLIRFGASKSFEVTNRMLYTPLHLGAKEGCALAVDVLIRCGALEHMSYACDSTPMQLASEHGHLDVVRVLFNGGATVNEKEPTYREHPLNKAVEGGHMDVSQFLLDQGAVVNDRSGYNGELPLHKAAGRGHVKIVQLLLKHNADVNARDRGGFQPLHNAVHGGHMEVVKLLIETGAEVNSQDGADRVPLHWAALGGHLEVAELLIQKGAKINARDEFDRTPLALAEENKKEETMRILKQHGGHK